MIKSELIPKIAATNQHLYHRDIERIVNVVLTKRDRRGAGTQRPGWSLGILAPSQSGIARPVSVAIHAPAGR
jgi:hypothetical protein